MELFKNTQNLWSADLSSSLKENEENQTALAVMIQKRSTSATIYQWMKAAKPEWSTSRKSDYLKSKMASMLGRLLKMSVRNWQRSTLPRHYRRRRDDGKERLQAQNLLSAIPIVRALEEILDMNFIRGLCRKDYSHTGQPSVDPIVLFKMMLIGYLFGIISERKLAEECTVNLAFRWYLGYDLDESTPNHSVISKPRGRFGKKVFEEFFQEVLSRVHWKSL